MSDRKYKKNNDQDQEQDQDQKQAELQAQLQAQAQGQLQGQAQGQGQFQFALNENENENDNDNDNKNENENSNENKNENSNELKNEVDNKVENSVDNKVENDVDNDIKNNVENHVENKVDVVVDVDIDLDLSALPSDNDVIDIDKIEDIHGSVIMPDVVNQTVQDGNAINIDQVNNIVDRDYLWDPDVTYSGGDFKMDAWAEGGEVKIEDAKIDIDADGGTFGNTLSASADAIVTQEAFTQNIVMGANIQFNRVDMNVAGDNLDNDTTF